MQSEKNVNKIDEQKLHDFMGNVINDLGATWNNVLVIIGDKLGLYKAMADSLNQLLEELTSPQEPPNVT